MIRKTCLTLSVGLLVAMLADSSYAQQPPSILDYLGRRAARLTAQLPPVPGTLDAWQTHRREILGKLTVALGLPEREPMKAAVVDSSLDGDLVVEKVAYLWAERAYVTATVIRDRKATGRRPAIVIPSGWLGHYTFQPYRKFVDAMARHGLVVLFIDDPRTGRRQAPRAGLYAAASAAGTQVAGIQTFDAMRGLDYLATRTDVDPNKIGIAGLGEGALQAYLAAAIEPRFQFVAAVGGTTTYQSLVRAAGEGKGPEDPSAFVAGMLRFADMDRIAACIAPRPVLIAGGSGTWPGDGCAKVVDTMKAVYGLHDAADQIRFVPGGPSVDMTPHIAEITRWIDAHVLPSLKDSGAPPAAYGKPEDPDFSMLHYMQRQLARQTSSPDRADVVGWLRDACALPNLKPAADKVVKVSEADGLVTERLVLGIDEDYCCPAVLIHSAGAAAAKQAAVILSHGDRQSAADAEIVEAARRLASAGYWVIVPEHASVHPQSLQPLADAEQPDFYGDELATFYGPADAVGLPPLALRVAENIAALRYLIARKEVDADRIVIAGTGIGGVDACLAAALDGRIAAAASVDATTVRDWVLNVAPGEFRFRHVMPYLPQMPADLDALYGAIAPRPLIVTRLQTGWPRSGFEQVAATAAAAYKSHQADAALLTLGPRDVTEQLETDSPPGARKQLIAAVRTLVPAPPQPGIVGTPGNLKSRATADSAAGLIWIVAEMGGYEQEFTGGGYRLATWSFFNDNGAAQKGHLITPLIFRKEGPKFVLTAVGKTRTNTGTGLQAFAFEPVENGGTDQVDAEHYFGWHTGDLKGNANAGVVEFNDAPDALMTILTADGQMVGQKLKTGATYSVQSQYRRQYSVTAVSRRE
ncbi:MAG: hypothetical protein HQ567_32320 [Candidatus Nealsonbacteria bacterium]|nr:hypothetical protein [Candidatus Nealsonbacteria bacterium]